MADDKAKVTPPADEVQGAESAEQTTASVPAEKGDEKPAEKAGETTGDEPAASEAPEETKPTEEKTSQESEATKATEDNEAEGAAAAGEPAESGANGTPAAAPKKSGGKRKSTGPPEHRTKKLNKKKSAARITNLDAKPGDLYLAHQKGHSAWPAIIADDDMLPEVVQNKRPVTAKRPDGTYTKEDYADGGKRVADRTYPIMYLYTNDFAWIKNTDLTPLDAEDCKDVSEKGKKKDLVEAYKVAAEGYDLQYFKDLLSEHQRQLEEERVAREELEAAKQAKKEQKKRKSTAAKGEDDDVEMAEAGGEKKKSTKKRKKDAESDVEADKPAQKTPKTGTKLKLTTTPKTPKAAESAKKPRAKAKEGGAKKRAAKAASESEEEEAESPKPAAKPLDPQEALDLRQKEVRFLRAKLQNGLLSRDQAPQESDMDAMSSCLGKLESYGDLEGSIVRSTKIHKVLKGIIKLSSIPREEDLKFRERCLNLLEKWKTLLGSDIPKPAEAKPAENGVKEDVNGKQDAPAEGEKDAEKDVEMTDAPEATENPDEAAAPEAKEAETAVEA